MKVAQYIRRQQYKLISGDDENQSGINMADLMMWLVIAALIVAAALQAIGSYQKSAYIYQMKNDLRGAVSLANTNGTYIGTVEEPQVAEAVKSSNKSEGVTLTWGIVLDESSPSADGHDEAPQASGNSPFSLVSFSTSTVPVSQPTVTREGKSSYILVAHHAKAPDISVVYFFNDVSPYYTGTAVIANDDDFEIVGGTAAQLPEEPEPSEPSTPESPSTPVVSEQAPDAPKANKDPRTKRFMFCHNGTMHSNSYNGMVNGHGHHNDDIIPPVPPQNYAGHNWNAKTAKIFYNNCQPLPAS